MQTHTKNKQPATKTRGKVFKVKVQSPLCMSSTAVGLVHTPPYGFALSGSLADALLGL